jgi:hypothetical protein
MTDWKPCCRLLAVVSRARGWPLGLLLQRLAHLGSRFFGNTEPTLTELLGAVSNPKANETRTGCLATTILGACNPESKGL